MEPAINIALRAARKAGDIIVRAAERMDLVKIEEKQKNDFVTNIDKESEKEIIYHLRKAWPHHNIVGEESGLIKGLESSDPDEYTWYIDPLDGTTNFVRGIPHFAVSLGCVKNGRLEYGVILDPIRNEEFTATRGRGAALNGKRMRVTNQAQFAGALIGTGIPYRADQQPFLRNYMQCTETLASNGSGIRRGGSAALDLAYVAAGRLDAFWEFGLKPWDTAAGMLMIQEAGGLIADFKGGSSSLESGNIVCGNPKIFKPLLQLINENLGHAPSF